jgi:hypothetical protein
MIRQVTSFCAVRYNASRATRPKLARAFLGILNRVHDLLLSSADPERDLLDFLSKPHRDPDLVRACKEVFEHLGSAP